MRLYGKRMFHSNLFTYFNLFTFSLFTLAAQSTVWINTDEIKVNISEMNDKYKLCIRLANERFSCGPAKALQGKIREKCRVGTHRRLTQSYEGENRLSLQEIENLTMVFDVNH